MVVHGGDERLFWVPSQRTCWLRKDRKKEESKPCRNLKEKQMSKGITKTKISAKKKIKIKISAHV